MKRALSILALASLAACGGGGGEPDPAPAVSKDPVTAPVAAPNADPAPAEVAFINPGCKEVDGHWECDLIASDQPIGVNVGPDVWVRFTNKTGKHLQINSIQGRMAEEVTHWSEYCVFLNGWHGQNEAGIGEVGCKSKRPGQYYEPILFGNGTGLSIPPGSEIIMGQHSEPEPMAHTYVLDVKAQTAGLLSWRQPRQDEIYECNGQMQTTSWAPWVNTTDREMHLSGAGIYAESGKPEAPTTMSGACIFVLDTTGATKYQNCDMAIRSRGEVSFPVVKFGPGESVVAQAVNSCPVGGGWDFVSYLRVW